MTGKFLCRLGMVLLFGHGLNGMAAMPADAWQFVSEFKNLPEENSPGWKRGGEGEAFLENDRVHLRSGLEGGVAYSLHGGEGDAVWDGLKPSTVSWRARVIDSVPKDVGGHVSVRTGSRMFLIPITDREEKTYHFMFTEEGDGRLFINGEEQGVVKARPLTDSKLTNGILFGDLGGSTGGETEWAEFRWTNTGAFEP